MIIVTTVVAAGVGEVLSEAFSDQCLSTAFYAFNSSVFYELWVSSIKVLLSTFYVSDSSMFY